MVQMIGKAVQDSIYLEGYEPHWSDTPLVGTVGRITFTEPRWIPRPPRNYDVDPQPLFAKWEDLQTLTQRVWFEPIADEL